MHIPAEQLCRKSASQKGLVRCLSHVCGVRPGQSCCCSSRSVNVFSCHLWMTMNSWHGRVTIIWPRRAGQSDPSISYVFPFWELSGGGRQSTRPHYSSQSPNHFGQMFLRHKWKLLSLNFIWVKVLEYRLLTVLQYCYIFFFCRQHSYIAFMMHYQTIITL